MTALKRIFQVLAGLLLLAMLGLGFGSAWVTNNPEAVADVAANVVELEYANSFRDAGPAREQLKAQHRARDAGWGHGQSLSEDANSGSGGWAD